MQNNTNESEGDELAQNTTDLIVIFPSNENASVVECPDNKETVNRVAIINSTECTYIFKGGANIASPPVQLIMPVQPDEEEEMKHFNDPGVLPLHMDKTIEQARTELREKITTFVQSDMGIATIGAVSTVTGIILISLLLKYIYKKFKTQRRWFPDWNGGAI